MYIDLTCKDENINSMDANEFSLYFINKLALCWKYPEFVSIESPSVFVFDVMAKYNTKTNIELWYILILKLLIMLTKVQKLYYLNSYLCNLEVYIKNNEINDEIIKTINNCNNLIYRDKITISLFDAFTQEDKIIYKVANKKEEIKLNSSKYFVKKNLNQFNIEKIISKELFSNPNFSLFDCLYDIFLMYQTNARDEIFLNNKEKDELEIKAILFENAELFVFNIFSKHKDEIMNIICSEIAKEQLALEDESNESNERNE